jgi:hypothetical protein
MARYASRHQLVLTEEIVPLDGLDLIDGDGSDDAEPSEAAAAGSGLGVIDPLAFDLGREEPARTDPRADDPGADRGTRATETEGDDNVEQDSAKRAGELADAKEPWVASVDHSDPAPARRPSASSRRGPSHARLGERALAIGVVVLVVVGVVVAAFASDLTHRAAPARRAAQAPVAGQPVPLSLPYRKPAARRTRRPQRHHHHRRRRHHHGAHRRHRRHRHGGARWHSAPPASAATSAPAAAPAAPPPATARPGGGSPTGSSAGPADESANGSTGGSSTRSGAGSSPGHGASSDPTFEAGF